MHGGRRASCARRSRRRRWPCSRRRRSDPPTGAISSGAASGDRGTARDGSRTARRERQGGDVIHRDHVGVAGAAGGDALLSNELTRTRPVDVVPTRPPPHAGPRPGPTARSTSSSRPHPARSGTSRRKPLDVTKSAAYRATSPHREENRHRPHEFPRAPEPCRQLHHPFGQAVAQQHPAPGQMTVEESDRRRRSPSSTGRRDRGSDRHVVEMAGEPVQPERDHDVRIELVEQLRRHPDQARRRPPRVRHPDSRGTEPRRARVPCPPPRARTLERRSMWLSRHARVPDLAGTTLGERDHPNFGAAICVLGQRATGAEGLVIGMGEHPHARGGRRRERLAEVVCVTDHRRISRRFGGGRTGDPT